MNSQDIIAHNRKAWNRSVKEADCWTIICSEKEISDARAGNPEILLSPHKKVPQSWLNQLSGKKVLGLAAGGGQQGPILAAAGAKVVVFDLSEDQLEQDLKAAKQYDLDIQVEQGAAHDLSAFPDQSFDLIVNPCSNCFFPELEPVWKECHRVLKPGGRMMYCFLNPVTYQFDFEKANQGTFELKYAQPYSDIRSLTKEERKRFIREDSQYEFGHSLESQMGLLLRNGFVLEDLYEDIWGEKFREKIDQFLPQYLCALARKEGSVP